jgi:hypothetical protein
MESDINLYAKYGTFPGNSDLKIIILNYLLTITGLWII